jgi:RNA polymerase sigma-70 factor (ECF subfamily)
MISTSKSIEMNPVGNEVFLQYFRELYPKLMSLSCSFVDDYVAEDMVQDAFVALWEQKGQVRNIPAFMYKSVKNNCLNYIKHNHVVSDYEQKVRIAESRILFLNERMDENDVFKQIEYSDIRSKIEVALSKLPPRTAEAFKLYYFEEFTAKEVAEAMNISPRTVEVHVQKALSLLRDELKDLMLLYPLLSLLLKNHF